MKKVCVVTGTRAEYGLLKPLIKKIEMSENLELRLAVTGSHLSPEFGMTYREIEEDGYDIDVKIEMLLSSDTATGITKSMALALMGFSDYFERKRPDLIVILGDRYEMLMVAGAATIHKIPIAHIHGGEITELAYDDVIRHSLTKMSHLHFAATEEYRKRIIQLGEPPESVYNVGALGVENVKKVALWPKERIEEELEISFDRETILVTYHPVTLEDISLEAQIKNILMVIEEYPNLQVIFTKANADTEGRKINQMIDDFVEKNKERCKVFTSLGQVRYLSVVRYCHGVVGNSSSGIIEIPSFHIPTLNIGNRQKGRIAATSVVHTGYEAEDIKVGLDIILSEEFRKEIKKCKNPYEGVDTSASIIGIIEERLALGIKVNKKFHDLILSEDMTD